MSLPADPATMSSPVPPGVSRWPRLHRVGTSSNLDPDQVLNPEELVVAVHPQRCSRVRLAATPTADADVDHGVDAALTGEHVITGPAVDQVVAGRLVPTENAVGAGATVQRVVARPAVDQVVARVRR